MLLLHTRFNMSIPKEKEVAYAGKKMKVQYSTRARQGRDHYFGNSDIETPKIQMEGKWLEALGFHIGDAIQVSCEEASIHISLASPAQSEPAMVCDTETGYASK